MNDIDRMEEVIVKLKEEISGLKKRMDDIGRERIVMIPYQPYVPYEPYRPYIPWTPYDVWYTSTATTDSSNKADIKLGEF